MLRITVLSHTPEEVVLKVEGRLAGDNVPLLEQEVNRWRPQTAQVVLDLKGVRFIDRACMGLLHRWIIAGATLCNGSAFIRALLAANGLVVQPEVPA